MQHFPQRYGGRTAFNTLRTGVRQTPQVPQEVVQVVAQASQELQERLCLQPASADPENAKTAIKQTTATKFFILKASLKKERQPLTFE